jgi:ABC-type Mn2+/Zn2+ transport system permease subunit
VVVVPLAVGFALVSVWSGLVLATMFNLPPSFLVVGVATAIWGIAYGVTARRRYAAPPPADDHHHHPDESAALL